MVQMSKFTLLRPLKRHIFTEGFQTRGGLMGIRAILPAFLNTRISCPCVGSSGIKILLGMLGLGENVNLRHYCVSRQL